ncbi:MAG: transposase [Lachnospiraceae bacterium]|nr:transposase [Lachnospiraceae bacterium]
MNSIDKQWPEKVEPASQKQIHALEEIADLKQYGKSIPYAYLLFLEEMGQNDNGLLEQEWDGYTEVNIDSILRDYLRYIDEHKPAYKLLENHIPGKDIILYDRGFASAALIKKLEEKGVYFVARVSKSFI